VIYVLIIKYNSCSEWIIVANGVTPNKKIGQTLQQVLHVVTPNKKIGQTYKYCR